uniref:S-protein homolog n=1 Tax=Cajanus cajan TaxID=3821 RepID=A0A151RWX5_CAJCA|nr:hypothetical protein KK1_031295 [Cajanus cajan]
MCTSIHVVALLLVLTMWSSFANSCETCLTPSMIHYSNNTEMKIVVITITSGMSHSDPPLFYFFNNEETQTYLEPGKSFVKFTNFDRKIILMYWDVLCAIFYAYDPSSEGDHQRIYWLVNPEGVFHSWDNKSWEKRKSWNSNNCL